jgi:hypothetical protein
VSGGLEQHAEAPLDEALNVISSSEHLGKDVKVKGHHEVFRHWGVLSIG